MELKVRFQIPPAQCRRGLVKRYTFSMFRFQSGTYVKYN